MKEEGVSYISLCLENFMNKKFSSALLGIWDHTILDETTRFECLISI